MRQGQQNRRGRGRGGRRTQNPLTRNYESNGPDVKIRGTAAHVAEKYGSLARDALSSSDPVTAENYFQHAEHYNRIIMAAQLQMQPNVPQPAETTLNGAGAAAPASASAPAPAQAKPKAEPADDAELGTVATANSSPLGVAELAVSANGDTVFECPAADSHDVDETVFAHAAHFFIGGSAAFHRRQVHFVKNALLRRARVLPGFHASGGEPFGN